MLKTRVDSNSVFSSGSGDHHPYYVDIMTKAFHDVYEISKKEKVHMRLAAYMVVVKRVADCAKPKGWV